VTRAELKAMGVRVSFITRVLHSGGVWTAWVYGVPLTSWVCVARGFPTRRAAEQYARQIRKAMRGE